MQIINKKIPAAILAILVLMLFSVSLALAVPSLQLYIPGASYDYEDDSWMSYDNPFSLEVILAKK